MADYQAMYAVLFRKITAIVEELQNVQQQTEETYISSESPNIRVIKADEMKEKTLMNNQERQVQRMNKVLQALYDGELYPAEQDRPKAEEYIALRKKHYQSYESFIKKLGSPLDQEFIQIMDEQLDAVPLELSETFIAGFQLGAKMMIEVFEDNH